MFRRKPPVQPERPLEQSATAPHCDNRVLHGPGECVYCDKYPTWQMVRLIWRINFTGESDPHRLPCPSETTRDVDTINRWPGNRPRTHVNVQGILDGERNVW